ncbi:response regulator transcription factor [Ruminococcus flavefaciens]|jgi:two-component system alkaline phosphatase synthesis response regulator PhoP|uniref:Stage 0 sporulation protein A homolog n=1 Tax=Ruminococcus flavefaciens TaxID=1265 RepID=A0A315Y0N9_RUMFL|nr:response regulator transcription factor [Ruminococcus flavefaciens]PWJ12717.1 two-component system alkaline phosphatase synthesis response regulator PhoP [Ruminococcus flavefaciens]SSA49368.1 two-component system, OmpR family, alkaline phosphatase synthesis response regulator PhoP [Ruminococcus flavefaciens]
MLIYIVEDEESIRELESYALEKNDFEVMSFENSVEFYKALEISLPDLILLDIMLPGDDGLTILKKLRDNAEHKNIPVIIISAKDTELDRVKGLDLGADDYMCKPFGVMEMVSRVKARLRGVFEQKDHLKYMGITISEKTREVTVNGEQIELTYKEFELLKLFMYNPKIVLKRDIILDKIWGRDSTGRTLDVHIRTLRAKLGECGRYIVTVRNVGYKLDKDE